MGTKPFKNRRLQRVAAAAVVLAALPALTSCSDLVSRGFLPGARDTTNNTELITDLWVNSWIAALVVGVITWGLMIWVVVAYRRRKNTVGFPAQLSYNLPLEVFYLAIPLIVIGVLFVFTDREQRAIDERYPNPDVVIDVFGKQWSWDFNYVKEQVHEDAGQQAHLTGAYGAPDRLPTLYLPVGKKVELHLQSRDVQHSFWVVDFLQKRDLYPGHEQYNPYINITPNRIGEYMGKCAELCGEYHSEMLFKVRVVSQQDYDSHIADLKAKGNTGNLGADFDRQPLSAPAPQVTEPAE
ncbi:cytochrome c oxidase subunit II [Pseudarthrobacter phenanthrenivorans]|jgi:cytochrome c oxidase subunit 2|uniref:cytochrome-c oxidase n=1 Tax=Pseudarthrobacter phenanthrenivorans TaxID=361575 RepID=A0A0B4DJA6_PSEPS|nr:MULTISPECIES: cytochrome c oxidase subunit II [Micrococcaceae]KIC66741.1 cytochrome C oxidase subunit II [Pseudarthrobacter phenanthrenivorans]MDJ0455765.1 cytochrome c oxidase subunit II [Arthrobacter sp. NQ7]